MGRTVPTYRDALEERLRQWEHEFGRALPDPGDRASFHRLLQGARRYIPQGTMMSSGDLLERILLSVLLDLARELERLRRPGAPEELGGVDAHGDLLGA
jgi:hypothetical protein